LSRGLLSQWPSVLWPFVCGLLSRGLLSVPQAYKQSVDEYMDPASRGGVGFLELGAQILEGV